jgi:cyclohexa-1,5-dienecarbonyl-CoA hydratase
MSHVKLSQDGGVARLTLDRPPVNVLTTRMLLDLAGHLEQIADDDAVRVVLLDAAGKLFSAGVDVEDHVGDKVRSMMEALDRLFGVLARVPQPTVAAVQGAALGGGCELVLGTDLCLASSRAKFGQPEIKLGLFAPPASMLLPRLVGERKALELLLTGDPVSAEEACRLGLVNRVLPDEGFRDEVDRFMAELAGLSGPALRLAKRAVLETRGRGVDEAQRGLRDLYLNELMQTHDANEGLAAFLEKREPAWKHA